MGQLTALLLSRDPEAQRMLSSVLRKVGVETETFHGPAPGLRALKSKKYEGIIVDCDDLDCGTDMLAMLRNEHFTRTTIVFALVHGITSMHDAFELGANFVLEKPLVHDRVMRCFRAAQGLMLGERRRYFRYEVDFSIYLDFPGFKDAVATVRDLSLGGIQVHTNLALAPEMVGNFRFMLPDGEPVSGACNVVWKLGDSVGIRFGEIPHKYRMSLEKWLAKRFDELHPLVTPIIPDVPDKSLVN
jgi:CheY-like chemotaxis protein